MKLSFALFLSLAVYALPGAAQPKSDHDSHHPSTKSAQQAAFADGEVRKVDKDAKKITIKHGPLEALDMPPMTMVFRVSDPAMLEGVKAGDKVKFQVEKRGGALTLTKLLPN